MEKEVISNPILWSPTEERIKSSQMYKFMLYINEKYNLKLSNFSEWFCPGENSETTLHMPI